MYKLGIFDPSRTLMSSVIYYPLLFSYHFSSHPPLLVLVRSFLFVLPHPSVQKPPVVFLLPRASNRSSLRSHSSSRVREALSLLLFYPTDPDGSLRAVRQVRVSESSLEQLILLHSLHSPVVDSVSGSFVQPRPRSCYE